MTQIKNKEFIKILSNESDGEYHMYECEDFIDLFTRTVEKLLLDGKSVTLRDFGTFKPKFNKARDIYSGLEQKTITVEPSITMQFVASRQLQERMKVSSRKGGCESSDNRR